MNYLNEFWVGISGAVVGGVFSILGVFLTMRYQRALDQEQRRIERMPFLKFRIEKYSAVEDTNVDYSFIGIIGNELLTSANPELDVTYSCIAVTPTLSAVFNLKIVDVYMSDLGMLNKTDAFSPMSRRLLPEETERQVFNCLNKTNCNQDVVIRYEYEDIFGNVYLQDVFFQYYETDFDGKCKVLSIWEVCQPQLSARMNDRRKCKKLNITNLENVIKENMV